MNTPLFTEDRSAAMRVALVERVEEEHAFTTRPRRFLRTPLIALLATLALGAGGVTAATATGLITWPLLTQDPLPGGQTAESASSTLEAVGQGAQTVDLLARPDGATHVSVKFTCLTAATTYTWGLDAGGNNPSSSCDESQLGTVSAMAWYDFPVSPGTHTLYVAADPDAAWAVSWVYLSKAETEWAVNANGDTYGIQKEDGSAPDLMAVVATNGREGFVYTDELARADGSAAVLEFHSPEEALAWQEEMTGKTVSVPVYEPDGTTAIGEFVIRY